MRTHKKDALQVNSEDIDAKLKDIERELIDKQYIEYEKYSEELKFYALHKTFGGNDNEPIRSGR